MKLIPMYKPRHSDFPRIWYKDYAVYFLRVYGAVVVSNLNWDYMVSSGTLIKIDSK